MKQYNKVYHILKVAIEKSKRDRLSEHAAALSYHMILSLPGLVMIFLISINLLIINRPISQLNQILARYFGENVTKLVLELMTNLRSRETNSIVGIFGILVILYSGVNGFNNIENTLNHIWRKESSQDNILISLRKRLNKLLLVYINIFIIFSFGLLMSIVNNLLSRSVSTFINLIGSYLLIFTLFSVMYKELHNVDLSWKETTIASSLTGFLFIAVQYILSYYFSLVSFGSLFGSSGAVIVLLFWVNIYAHVFYFGSEIIHTLRRN